MTTSSISSTTIGWAAIITGASAILAVIFLAMMATVNNSFGKVNDVFNSIIGVSSAVLAIMLYTKFHDKSAVLSQIALGLVVLGAIFTIAGSIKVMSGSTGFVLAGWFTGIGNALIGLWLLFICYTHLGGNLLPNNLAVFGVVVGAFMAFGLIGIFGIIEKIDSMESMPWYLFLAFFSYLGTYILYPIWAILLGRLLLLK